MRVIREAILEAHQNVDKYGGTWYVCSDDFFSVVKESYFINEDGTRKDKPFISLYNTDDMFYGNHGMGHRIEYNDGEVEFVRMNVDDEDYEQPYGERFRGREMEVVGNPGIGKSRMVRNKEITSKLLEVMDDLADVSNEDKDKDVYMITNPHIDDYKLPFIDGKKYDMASGKRKDDTIGGSISELKRKINKNKRKKRPKKTHRKKK